MSLLFLTMFFPLNILSGTALAQTKPVQCPQGKLCPLKVPSPTQKSAPTTTTYNLTVNASQDLPGLDTGINLSSGSNITITAQGWVSYGIEGTGYCDGTPLTNPDGQRMLNGTPCDPKFDSGAVLSSSPIGELIASIGSSGWFAVGSSDGFTVATSGRLFLLYNDDSGFYGDNSGSYQVTITTSTSPTLTVTAVYTRDGNGNVQNTFAPGAAIQYVVNVNNSSGNSMNITLHYQTHGPNNNSIFDNNYTATIPQGASGWYVQGTVPSNAPTGTYTALVHVADQNNTQNQSSGQSQFTVTSNRGKLFLFIQGINSTLSTSDATNNIIPTNKYSFGQSNGIYPFLLKTYPTAQFRMFSYNGADSSGTPKSYLCQNTFTQHLNVYVSRLKAQIISYLNNHPNTDVYLIGHSMGGDVALGLLAYFRIHGFLQVNGGKIAGVVSFDSPLGGTANDLLASYYFTKMHFQAVCPALVPKNKPALPVFSLQDIFNIFGTGSSRPHGGINSIMLTLYGGDFSNQEVAAAAASNNSPVLTVGDLLDFTYDPAACPTPLGITDFGSTQWVADQGSNSGVYGRMFTDNTGLQKCTNLASQIAVNHFDVLRNATVQTGLQQFIDGQTPSALTIAPPGH